MSSFAVDVSELDAYALQLESAAEIVEGAAYNVVRRWSGKIVREAKRIVPVDTGNLRKSIRFDPSTRHITATGGAHGRTYAGFVEFGTSRMAPRPYLRPALAKFRKPFHDDMLQLGAGLLGTKTAARGSLRGAASLGRFSLGQQLEAGMYQEGP